MIVNEAQRPTRDGSPAPADGMPSADRSAHRRRAGFAVLLCAFAVAVAGAIGARAAMEPRIAALEAEAASARAEARDAVSDLAALEQEYGDLRTVARFSAEFDIPADLAAAIHRAARRENVKPDVAFRLVSTESAFRQYALSPVGAVGYAQVMPATAAWLEPGVSERDLFDRDTNLRLGFRYLRMLLDQYGDVRLALLAYNRGPSVVNSLLSRGEDPGNGYARQILGTE